jgi:hypothetical protein
MINIKKFIDKIAIADGTQGKTIVLPISEARGLRDELTKLMSDNYELLSGKSKTEPAVTHIELLGGRF